MPYVYDNPVLLALLSINFNSFDWSLILDSGWLHGTSLCCPNSWTCDSINGSSQWIFFGSSWRRHDKAYLQKWNDGKSILCKMYVMVD